MLAQGCTVQWSNRLRSQAAMGDTTGAHVGICDPAGCFSPQDTIFQAPTLSGQSHKGTLGVKSAVARFAGQSGACHCLVMLSLSVPKFKVG